MLTSEYNLWKSQVNEEDAARVTFDQYRKAVCYVGDYDYKSIRDKQIGRELVFKIGVYTVAAIVAVPCVLTGNAPGALLSFSVAGYICGSTSVTGAITGTNPISGRTITSEERWVEGISGGVQVLSGAYGIYSYAPQAFANVLNTPSPPIRFVADIVDDVNSGAGGAEGGKYSTFGEMSPEDGIRYNQWVKLREAGLDQAKINDIILTNKGLRPNPNTYLSETYINSHLNQFNGGVTKIMTQAPSGTAGPPGGTFVMPSSVADDCIAQAGGDISKLEKLLSLDSGSLGTSPIRVDIKSPNNIRIPSGNELGANSQWLPGGNTSGGIPEATITSPKLGEYIVNPIN